MTARELFLKGVDEGYSKKLLDDLAEVDNGFYIHLAGTRWDKFNYKKGQEKLYEVDRKGNFIFLCGKNWEEFDIGSGLAKLEEINPDLYWLFRTKNGWKLTGEQIDSIDERDYGVYAFLEYKSGGMTKKEALGRNPNSKWKKKIKDFGRIK